MNATWELHTDGDWWLVDANGKIVADVHRMGLWGPWYVGQDRYASEAAAKKAAERVVLGEGTSHG